MLEWWAKRELSRPTCEFLLGEDFETILGVAFRWCNQEIPTSEQACIPDEVRQMTYRLIRGFYKGGLGLRMPDGHKVPREPMFFFIKDINPWRNLLWRCLGHAQFEIAHLSKLFVERSELLQWCNNEQLTPPAFWVKNPSKEATSRKQPLENRLRNDVLDRLVCQAIARVYWEIDSNIHPAHLAASRAINVYGNGRLYSDENTVKSWISEVDHLKELGHRKTGRPGKISYRIDLETGGLAE